MIEIFAAAVASKEVVAQSYAGNWWKRQIQDDPSLKAAHDKEVGMPAKRKFKFDHVRLKLDAMEEEIEE